MTISKNTFIDAYGIELNDDLNGQYTDQESRNGDHQLNGSQQSAGPNARQAARQQHRFDGPQNHQTLRGPHFRVPASKPATQEATWADLSVIDVGAGWSPPPEDAAATPIASAGPKSVAQQTASPETTVAAAVESADQVAPSVEAPKPVVAPVAQEEVVEVSVTETDEVDANEAHFEQDEAATLLATPVVAAWEVDRFAWPADIEALFEGQAAYFEHAGQKLLAASREGLSKLAITSARPGEGTTTMTLCLARAVAAVGGRVAVLDGNLRNAQIGKTLSLEFASGWQVAAAGAVELAEAAIAGLEEGITLFPAAATSEGIGRLADETVGELLRSAAAGFDLLLIDAGQDDFGENATQIDAAMVVRDVRRTSEQQSLAAALLLRDAGVKAVGIAENFSEPHESAAAA
jgi:Mrp family chromosome partitioning ATPase